MGQCQGHGFQYCTVERETLRVINRPQRRPTENGTIRKAQAIVLQNCIERFSRSVCVSRVWRLSGVDLLSLKPLARQ